MFAILLFLFLLLLLIIIIMTINIIILIIIIIIVIIIIICIIISKILINKWENWIISKIVIIIYKLDVKVPNTVAIMADSNARVSSDDIVLHRQDRRPSFF